MAKNCNSFSYQEGHLKKEELDITREVLIIQSFNILLIGIDDDGNVANFVETE